MVLHTWGQRLQHHPHIHCVVPAGGLAPDGARWIHARPRFFLPIPVLRQVFRGKLVAGLREAFAQGRLQFPGALQPLATAVAFRAFLRSLYRQAWVVYAKPPFGSPGPRAALSRAVHAPRRDLESPARRRDRRHRLVSLEGLSPRQSDPHAHPRRARNSSGAFCCTCCRSASSGFAISASSRRGAAPHDLAQCRQALAVAPTPAPADAPIVTRRPTHVAVPPLWRADARRRTADRAPALPRGRDRRAASMTPRRPCATSGRRPQPRRPRDRRRCARPSRSARRAGRPVLRHPPRIPSDDDRARLGDIVTRAPAPPAHDSTHIAGAPRPPQTPAASS